ncbi:hypothetical protein BUALT_Bualt14G0091100 [Buddleja alternifolia]|uniref:Protein TIME FOR COFFEE n=1 Tax=Buddleja alternifolia TaxID=168488 RepID=A0AAV6WRL1_9LAMI|nr:hypothetical protein BUALT_Bualt14G0091100 [Buddleja alternifolia]
MSATEAFVAVGSDRIVEEIRPEIELNLDVRRVFRIERPEELVLSALMASTDEDIEPTVSETLQVDAYSVYEDGGVEMQESSVNDEEDDEYEDTTTTAAAVASVKVFRPPPVWKSGDEMIGVPVPRKARSVSTKRSHEWISSSSNNNSGGGVSGGEPHILRQPSSSPVRQGLVPTSTPIPAAPMSPSSSNVSIRKKLKPSANNSGPKLKPPKVSSKPSSSNPEELEIEIAEVLYGLMTQSQGPSSKKEDSREVNRSSGDAKSRNSSPISNSTSNNNPILGSASTHLSAVGKCCAYCNFSLSLFKFMAKTLKFRFDFAAPKRKRPRQIPENSSYGARSSPISGKPDMDQTPKSEISSPVLERVSGSTAENGFQMGSNLVNSQAQAAQPPEPTAPESTRLDSECKPVAEELRESSNLVVKEEVRSPKEKESPAVRLAESSNRASSSSTVTASLAATMIKANSTVSEMESQREDKFEIDLMAPPPQGRSSPERGTDTDLRAAAVDQKPVLSNTDADLKPVVSKDKEDDKGKSGKDNSANTASEEKKGKGTGEEGESHKAIENKERNIDLRLDLEKLERDGNKLQMQAQKQQQQQQQIPVKATREEPLTEKSGQSANSLPLPMPMANWPGGLPSMGYMAPLQGVVSMDGTTVTPAPIQPLFTQPRPKRCATHCHIARNIHYLQQFMKMNPYWPAAPGSASLFGSKPCNVNVMPDLHGNLAVRGVNNAPQDKGPSVVNIPNHVSKDKASQPASTPDSTQRKQQILIQQAIPPVPPNNLLGPAFIFPLNQQQAAVAAAARPSGGKSPTTAGSVAAPSTAAGTGGGATTTSAPGGVATAMSFNFPNMAANETQYLAILQNGAYPFPIPTVGAPTNYRAAPGQAMPMFNSSFYSSQMIHPSQLQHQQQPPPTQPPPQLLQAHQNPSVSNNSSSSQKHSQRPQSSNGGPGSSNLQNFSTQKSQSSQQQSHHQNVHSSRPRHIENELGSEDSPSTDSRASRAPMNIYGHNFAMPIHPQNFALMAQPAGGGNGNQSEKKPHQQQQQGLKNGVESMPPHSFAMSFGPINGTGPGIDMASMAHNHAIFQTSPEATRQNIQMMAAAAAAAQVAQKKNFRISEDGKSGGGDSSAMDDERKSFSAKAQSVGVGQSIAFTRPDLSDSPITSIQASNVIESSARSLNPSSGPTRSSRPMTTNPVGGMNVQNAHIQAQAQAQFQQQQQQQMLIKQQQQMAVNRSKVPVTSNGSMYSDHLNSTSSMAAKFSNALTGFPQNLVPGNNSSPSQSPQWKSSTSTRAPTSQAPSSLSSSTPTALKNLPQQHSSRNQPQMHTQISFGGSQKPSTASQGQAPPNSNQAPSPPMMVGSPTTSSMSKGAGGSPRTTNSASNNNKSSQASSFSAQQQPKNSPSIHSQKSPSILGNPHIASSSSGGAKPQMQQQQPKTMQQQQQAQLFFSNPYTQAQSPHSTSTSSTNSGPGGYYMQQRRRPEQHQQSPGAPATSSTGVLSLSTSTNDPAKAIAAATCNVKGGGGLTSQTIIHASQFAAQSGGTLFPAGFPYVHPVPAAVQVKPAEQKQPAG